MFDSVHSENHWRIQLLITQCWCPVRKLINLKWVTQVCFLGLFGFSNSETRHIDCDPLHGVCYATRRSLVNNQVNTSGGEPWRARASAKVLVHALVCRDTPNTDVASAWRTGAHAAVRSCTYTNRALCKGWNCGATSFSPKEPSVVVGGKLGRVVRGWWTSRSTLRDSLLAVYFFMKKKHHFKF